MIYLLQLDLARDIRLKFGGFLHIEFFKFLPDASRHTDHTLRKLVEVERSEIVRSCVGDFKQTDAVDNAGALKQVFSHLRARAFGARYP